MARSVTNTHELKCCSCSRDQTTQSSTQQGKIAASSEEGFHSSINSIKLAHLYLRTRKVCQYAVNTVCHRDVHAASIAAVVAGGGSDDTHNGDDSKGYYASV
eukprot:16548-Heterococcus_DN1.PRE.2